MKIEHYSVVGRKGEFYWDSDTHHPSKTHSDLDPSTNGVEAQPHLFSRNGKRDQIWRKSEKQGKGSKKKKREKVCGDG